MGLLDFFKKKTANTVQKAKGVKTPDTALTSAEKQNIAVLTQNRVEEFSQDNLRGNAADELGKSKNPKAVAALLDAAKNDPAWNVRARALTALSEIALSRAGAPEVNREIFLVSLNDPDNYVVECAAKALGRLKEKDAIEPLLAIVLAYREGQDFTAAEAAVNALGEIGEDAVPVLLKELKHNPEKPWMVLRALAATGSPSALEVLQEGITDQTIPGYEQVYIIQGLAKIGTPDAVESLKNALDTATDEMVVKTIAKCLEDMHVEVKGLEAKKKAAEINAAKKLLTGLKTVRPGMTEDEADDLVGAGNFQMGANVVHNTRFGNFQFLVSGNRIAKILYTENVIEKIEKWLKEQN